MSLRKRLRYTKDNDAEQGTPTRSDTTETETKLNVKEDISIKAGKGLFSQKR